MQTVLDIEQQRQRQQASLDAAKNAAERNRCGQFATPIALARDIVKYAENWWDKRSGAADFLDPAFGTGAFYSALRQVFPSEAVCRAEGVEIDPAVFAAAETLWRASGLRVQCADFTRLAPPPPGQRFRLLLTNPPYVRHHHLAAEEKLRLQHLVRHALGIKISGLAGLYCYFLLLADQWLEPGALSVWLIPSEFMDVNYGDAIR